MSAATRHHAPLGPQIAEGSLVRLEGSPLPFRVRHFEGPFVVIEYPNDGRYAGRWRRHLIMPARENADV